MKTNLLKATLNLALLPSVARVGSADNSAFTFQGRVNNGGKFVTALWALVLMLIPLSHAAPGDVDAGFNPNPNYWAWGVAVQPDGKILIGGDFTAVRASPRNRMARLNADGLPDPDFNPNVSNSSVISTAVLGDGKIVIVGGFTNVAGVSRNRVARLNADGTLDPNFNPNANNWVFSTAVQADGKLLLQGMFTSLGGVPHNRIARLNPDGALDTGFNPDADGTVWSAAMQADGRIVIAGDFTSVNGTARNHVARLNTDGTLDSLFNPNVNDALRSLAVQADGKILLGGAFSMVGGTPRYNLARLNADGTLDGGFGPDPNGTVYSIMLQSDGRIVIGGSFGAVAGSTRTNLARVNADGTLDPSFQSRADNTPGCVAGQADGRILIGGMFNFVNGVSRNYLARLENDAATQLLTVTGTNRVQWLRGGASPEAQAVTFELSTDGGTNWTSLGAGMRIPGGWEQTGLSLPARAAVRARARVTGGYLDGSSGLIEAVEASSEAPLLTTLAPPYITTNYAVLSATVNPKGLPTTAWFQWGSTSNYSHSTAPLSVGSGSAAVAISEGVSGLTFGASYHYRVVASNSLGLAYGNDVAFAALAGGSDSLFVNSNQTLVLDCSTIRSAVSNYGIIVIDCPGTVIFAGPIYNHGTILATNGAALELYNVLTGPGTVSLANGAVIRQRAEPSPDFEIRLDRCVYPSSGVLSVKVRLGPGVETQNLQAVLVAPRSGDLEVLTLVPTGESGVFSNMTLVRRIDGVSEVQHYDGRLTAQANEMFLAMFSPTPSGGTGNSYAVIPGLLADFAVMEDPGFSNAPVRIMPQIVLSEDETNRPPGGKRIGTLALKDGAIGQLALDELILYPVNALQLSNFLAETEGTVIMDDRVGSNAVARSYLVRVNPARADVAHLAQMRALFGEQQELYASSPEALQILALALQYRLDGYGVAVNPRLIDTGHPAASDGLGGAVDLMREGVFANDVFGVRQAWAYLALWEKDQKRIPLAFLDQGFSANWDFRGFDPATPGHGIFQRDIQDGGALAEGVPTVGNNLFGEKSWHGNGVVTVAAGVLNNGWGGAGTGGQVAVPMLYRMGLLSYAFEMGRAIRQATVDGAGIVNISAAYPCQVFLNSGPNFEICSAAGRAALCTEVGKALFGASSLACGIFPPLCLEVTVAAQVAVSACYSTVLLGNPSGPVQEGIDFAREQGVVVVASAGNALGDTTVGGVTCSILRCGMQDVSDLLTVPATLHGVICVGQVSSTLPYRNLQLYGERVDVWAPADIRYFAPPTTAQVAPWHQQTERTFNGTSGAAPFVAGIVAMMQAVNPTLNPLNSGLTPGQRSAIPGRIRDMLRATATTDHATEDPDSPSRIVNAYAAVRLAAAGHVLDAAAHGYDDSAGFNEAWQDPNDSAATTPNSVLAILPDSFTDTIAALQPGGLSGGRLFRDADYYRWVTPSGFGIYVGGLLRLSYPKGSIYGTLTVDGKYGTPLSSADPLGEVREFAIPTLFNSTEYAIRVGSTWAGDDNVYRIEFFPASWRPGPAPDRFEGGPGNNRPENAVVLGGTNAPWEGGLCSRELVLSNLNFHFKDDRDWFAITYPPAGVCGSQCMCTTIVTENDVAIEAYDSLGKLVGRGNGQMLTCSRVARFVLAPVIKGGVANYDVRVVLNQPILVPSEECFPIIFRNVNTLFPFAYRYRGDPLRDNAANYTLDPAGRILNPLLYGIKWRGMFGFTLEARVPQTASLQLQLLTADRTVLATATTANLRSTNQFANLPVGLNAAGEGGPSAEDFGISGLTSVVLSVSYLLPGDYVLAVSHAQYGTPLELILPRDATDGVGVNFENSHSPGLVPGDLDQDGTVTTNDVMILHGLVTGITPSPEQVLIADATGDGVLTFDDLDLIRAQSAGQTNLFAIWPRPVFRETLTPAAAFRDSDEDGLPDWWELSRGLNPDDAGDALLDDDADGWTNVQEYQSATDPMDRSSHPAFEIARGTNGAVRLRFTGIFGNAYTVEFREALDESPWKWFAELDTQSSTQPVELPVAPNGRQRFYRLVTVRSP